MNCLNGCTVVLKRNVWHVSERPKPHFYLTRRSSRTVTACGQTSVCFLPPTCHYCRCLQSKRNSHTHTHAKWAVKDRALQYIGCCSVFFSFFYYIGKLYPKSWKLQLMWRDQPSSELMQQFYLRTLRLRLMSCGCRAVAAGQGLNSILQGWCVFSVAWLFADTSCLFFACFISW